MTFESTEKVKGSDAGFNSGLNSADILQAAKLPNTADNAGKASGFSLPKVDLFDGAKAKDNEQQLKVAETYIQLSPSVGAWKYTKKVDGFDSVVFTDTSNKKIGVLVNGKPQA